MNVAVVDDQEVIRSTFAEILRLENYTVDCYHSAESLLECDRFRDYGCLVVDFQLPGKNGVELLRCLREKSVATPAILISGNIDDEFNSAIVDLEDVVTLRKPCSVDVFLQTIERIAG